VALLRRRQTAACILIEGDSDAQTRLGEATSAHEPLLPIEKTLIGWSLSMGLALLVLLVVINRFIPLG